MENNHTGDSENFIRKMYGSLNMSWPVVFLYAAAAAVVTAVFLIFPAFKDTSFDRMGIYFEAWIFLAVILMANCKKPLESALKTFVFFLVSQPLIYFLQVPFSLLGFGLFRYYRYWFIWTLLTFPMAYIGWYIKKRNWLSLLILSPVLVYLTWTGVQAFQETLRRFPHLLVTGIFCFAQVLIYLYVFTSGKWQKLCGLVPVIAVAAVLLIRSGPDYLMQMNDTLPGETSFSSGAVVTVSDPSVAEVELTSPEEGRVTVRFFKYGSTVVTIEDGGDVQSYTVLAADEGGAVKTSITPADTGQ